VRKRETPKSVVKINSSQAKEKSATEEKGGLHKGGKTGAVLWEGRWSKKSVGNRRNVEKGSDSKQKNSAGRPR